MIDVDAYDFPKFTRRDNGMLLLEMNRPEHKNSMNPALHTELSRMRQPIIAAVNGTASAGGLAMALTSDISIMSETAKLLDPHVLGGLASGDHSAMMWPLLCGMAKAKYYIFSGEVFTGKEAERIGLVSKCVPADEVLTAALALADKLAAGSQVGIQLSKKALNGWFQLASPIFEHSVALEMLTFLHPDAAEGMRAGTERRLPVFPSTLK